MDAPLGAERLRSLSLLPARPAAASGRWSEPPRPVRGPARRGGGGERGGAPAAVNGAGGNDATDSVGTVQVGGGNASTSSVGSAQVSATRIGPDASAAVGGSTVHASLPAHVGGAGGNTAERALVTVQAGGGNNTRSSAVAVQA